MAERILQEASGGSNQDRSGLDMPGGVLGLWGRVIDSDVSVHTLLHFMIRVFIAGLAGWEKLGVRLLLLFSAWAPTGAAGSNINVALHAQSNYAMHGWVAGIGGAQ